MRRRLFAFIAILALLLVPIAPAEAAPLRVIIDGQEQRFDPPPQLVNGSTVVPMRAFFEALGASVSWDGATRTVTSTKDETEVKLTIDSPLAYVDGEAVQLAVPAQLIGSSTFIPLRFVGEALGANVHYAAGVITITTPAPAPDPEPEPEPDPQPISAEVHFIDVGQGDSILITAGDFDVLIDAGDRGYGEVVVSYLLAQGVDDIELLISTHPHADHIGGLPYVLESLPVARIIDSGVPHTSQTYINYLTLIDQLDIPFETPDSQSIDLTDGVQLDIIGPVAEYDDLNNSSVVAMLTAGDISVLLTGDMESKAEADLLHAADLAAEILKVGHHGSSTSTSTAFLAEVGPDVAIISVGEGNSYGHPADGTLTRLAGVEVYRTDLHGTIVITIDAQGYSIANDKGATPEQPTKPQDSVTVYITDTGTKYHREGCRYLNDSKAPLSLEDAVDAGYTPCGVCNPPKLDK